MFVTTCSQQLVVARSARCHHGRPDATAAGSDLGQRRAAETLGVLVVAIAGEQRMTVALDEPGQHASPRRVDRRHIAIGVSCEHLVGGPDGDDHAVADGHRSVGHDVEIALCRATTRLPVVADLRQRRTRARR